jgi:hypothetical protein
MVRPLTGKLQFMPKSYAGASVEAPALHFDSKRELTMKRIAVRLSEFGYYAEQPAAG